VVLGLPLLILAGCGGNAPYFMPRHPIDEGDYVLSVTWHFDITQYQIDYLFFPRVNFYFGLKDDNFVGIGGLPGICHLTGGHYFRTDNDNYYLLYGHMNQIFMGICNNPLFEVGGAYVNTDPDVSEFVSLGVSLGDGLSSNILSMPWNPADRSAFVRRMRFMPVIKIGILSRGVGFSADAYLGLWGTAYDNMMETIVHHNDTLLVIQPQEIDSTYYGALFYLKDGRTISFSRIPFEDLTVDLHNWKGLLWETDYIYWYEIKGTGKYLIVDYEQWEKEYAAGRPVVITRFPHDFGADFQRPRGMFRDVSLGFGIYDYHLR
jgi:hypothetical protein